MGKVLVFAGTTEGREIAGLLADAAVECSVCVATEYAREQLDDDRLTVYCGRLTQEQMRKRMEEDRVQAVVDATHPYAVLVSENVQRAAKEANIPLIRLRRSTKTGENDFLTFPTHEACSRWLARNTGNILLTTRSKNLGIYAKDEQLRKRLYVRVLPGEESIGLCTKQGILGRQIIAMQGPFSRQMNECILKEYSIDWMVTKLSGHAGGFEEKIEAHL